MRTIFIDRKNSEIVCDRGRMHIRFGEQRVKNSIPINLIEMVVVSAPVQFSSTLISQLTREGITLVFINPRDYSASAVTHGLLHNDATRRLYQYAVITSPHVQLTYCRQLIAQKINGQIAMLLRILRGRPDQRFKLIKSIESIQAIQLQACHSETLETLRGLEGAASAQMFSAYQSVFADALKFQGRNRRPPRDPVNVILSLTYTLMHAEAVRVIIAAGFDPLLGIYHQPAYGRESLACDLIELFRPQAEYWIWRLFAAQVLRLEHFDMSSGDSDKPCLLGKAGRQIFYQRYEIKASGWRRLMRKVCLTWLKRLQHDCGDTKNEQQ